MKQAVMVSPGKIEFREIDKPAPGPGEILMATKRIGVCGSDIHVFHGKHPYTSYPVVQGHEVSGVIAALGEGVEGLTVGEQITFMPQLTCGECYPCKHGMYHICESLKVYGFQTDGSGQEYFPLPAELVIKVPDNVPLDHAAMIEPVSVGVHAIRRGGGVEGKRVLVLGAGTIGNLTAQVALAQGARDVMITDVSPYKLDKARKVGIPHAINPNETSLETALLDAFGPERADLILECVGVQPTITDAVNVARKGTSIVVVGVFGDKPTVDLGLVQDRELSLVGTLMYQQVDYEIALDLIVGGKLNLDEMITAYFPFEQYLEAYHAIEAAKGDSLKVMISLD